jgi:hypothetical protein
MKKLILVAIAAAALAAPANAGSENGNGTGGPDVYNATSAVHGYSSNPLNQQVGLCGDAENFPHQWRPCWWN